MAIIRRTLALLLFALALPCAAQSLYVYPATVTAPRGSYQTVTAIVTGVNNKTVTWSTSGGTLVGTNPCVVNEPCTIALYTTTPGTYTVTATSNADGSTTKTSTITIGTSPTPVTGHPRFYFTPSNLAAMQAKATSTNKAYQAMRTQAIQYFAYDNATTAWGRSTGSTGWSCQGGNGQPAGSQWGNNKEFNAWLYAYMALMDPADPTYNWGCYGHDVWVNVASTYPTHGDFPGGANEWSDFSLQLALTTDWLMGAGALTSTGDLATARAFIAYFDKLALAYNPMPNPSGGLTTYNSSAMFDSTGPNQIYDLGGQRHRGGGNYALSALVMTVAAMTFDDNTTDDPTTLTNSCSAARDTLCSDFTAPNLGALRKYFFGGPLYDYWAHIEDPNVSWQAYQTAYGNLPTQPTCLSTDNVQHPCFGDGRGGESSEGSFYDYSMVRTAYMLNMLHTAGLDDPMIYGPQASAGTSAWWDLKWVEDLEFLTGNNVSGTVTNPGYTYLTTGDTQSYTRVFLDAAPEAAMLAYDALTGRTDTARTNALKWMTLNYAMGGPFGTQWGCVSTWCGFDKELTNANFSQTEPLDILFAISADDPVGGTLPTDPRPSLPLDLYNGSLNQHQILRDSWTNPTLFSFYSNNTLINHEYQQSSTYTVASKNEYITKPESQFNDYNKARTNASASNMLAIVNSTGTTCLFDPTYCSQWVEYDRGGQPSQGFEVGVNTLYHSELPAYAADIVDDTGSYNGTFWSGYNDISSASRSLVYLRGTNQVVTYDRAAVGHSASTQRLYENTTGVPTVSGNTASWLTRSATQKAYFTSLLPASGTLAPIKIVNYITTAAPYANLHLGDTMTATCTITYKDATTGTCNAAPLDDWSAYGGWTSSDPTVATIDPQTGLITALKVGYTEISVQVSGTNAYGGDAGFYYYLQVVAGASGVAWANVSDMDQIEDWEPSTALQVAPPGSPLSSQFLSVLEWGPSGMSQTSTTLVQSTLGNPFDGALIGTSLVMFQRTWPGSFSGMTYPASGATTHYISDLTPNTLFNISGAGAPTSATTDTAGVLTFAAAGTGSITIGVPPPYVTSIVVSPSPVTLTIGAGTQQFLATCHWSDASTSDCTSSAAWSSSNTAVASITSGGLATPLTVGGSTISAVYSGVTGTASLSSQNLPTSTWRGMTWNGLGIH